MKTLLFPRWCRTLGLVLLPVFYLGFMSDHMFDFLSTVPLGTKPEFMSFTNNNLTDEIEMCGIVLALFMIGFSRLKHEDEYIRHIRLQSLNLSIYINYILLVIAIFTVYSMEFLFVLAYDVFVLPLLYILIFNFNLYIRPRLFKKTVA